MMLVLKQMACACSQYLIATDIHIHVLLINWTTITITIDQVSKTMNIYFLWFYGLEVWDQSTSMVRFLVKPPFLVMFYMALLCACKESSPVSSSVQKSINPIIGILPSCSHLNSITSQRSLQIPSHWGQRFQYI